MLESVWSAACVLMIIGRFRFKAARPVPLYPCTHVPMYPCTHVPMYPCSYPWSLTLPLTTHASYTCIIVHMYTPPSNDPNAIP